MLLAIKILLTIVTLGYSLIPAVADFNKTHCHNPLWTPHARFHVVWQVCSFVSIALVALWLIWASNLGSTGLWVAAILATCAYAGFFAATFLRPVYGGRLYDDNGYLPYTQNLFGLGIQGDVNVTLFTSFSALLIVAYGLLVAL